MNAPKTSRAKMVLIYAHRDAGFLERSDFLYSLKALQRDKLVEFWCDLKMDRTDWDARIQEQLNEADVVVCLLTEPFLNSEYIRHVEARIIRKRQKKEGIIIVPILLKSCNWEHFAWIKKCHHLPKDGPIISNRKRDKATIYKEIYDHIRERILNRSTAGTMREPRTLGSLRRVLDSTYTKEEYKAAINESCRNAQKLVPDKSVRLMICNDAKEVLRKQPGKWLNKAQLAASDQNYLAKGDRKPDPKRVRWVLRCARLHPQGRVSERNE